MLPEERDFSLSPFCLLFFSACTYTLRDSWQSIDIRGDEVGVLRKHKHAGERRGKVTSEAHHSHRREWRVEKKKRRPFTLFYDLWLIFSSVYMNCWAGVWTVAMLLSGLQNRESSIAAELPIDADWGDVSGGKLSLYLSIKKARGASTHTHTHMRTLKVCARIPHRHALTHTGCLEDHRAACLTLGEQGRFSVQIKGAWERCCSEVDKPPSETHHCVSYTHSLLYPEYTCVPLGLHSTICCRPWIKSTAAPLVDALKLEKQYFKENVIKLKYAKLMWLRVKFQEVWQ